MADEPERDQGGQERQPEDGPGFLGDASSVAISLSQAILSPLNSLFKAQNHAARSFLNLVLQIGYPDSHAETAYTIDFTTEVEVAGERRRATISVPALALVPIAPLAVESAEFSLRLSVQKIFEHTQWRETSGKAGAERHWAPWYLVDKPVSLRGTVAPRPEGEGKARAEQEGAVEIKVKVSQVPAPAGLARLLTALTESARIETPEKPPDEKP